MNKTLLNGAYEVLSETEHFMVIKGENTGWACSETVRKAPNLFEALYERGLRVLMDSPRGDLYLEKTAAYDADRIEREHEAYLWSSYGARLAKTVREAIIAEQRPGGLLSRRFR